MSRAVVRQRSPIKHPWHYPTSMMYSAMWTLNLLFSAHISYGKGKYLNQTVFFTKVAKNYCLRNKKKYIHRIQLT